MQLEVFDLGTELPYLTMQSCMRAYAMSRSPQAPDKLLLLEHSPVYTLGQAANSDHILHKIDIPVLQSDRGGQVTYHGPGFLMGYFLFDLQQSGLGPRDFVRKIEQLLIDYLAIWGIQAEVQAGAPGVYVEGAKIASIGLRIRKQMSYHGICLNVDGSLSPFNHINPCGYSGMQMCRMMDFTGPVSMKAVKTGFIKAVTDSFGHTTLSYPLVKIEQAEEAH